MSMSINETCACGARINIEAEDAGRVSIAASDWRKGHRHEGEVENK